MQMIRRKCNKNVRIQTEIKIIRIIFITFFPQFTLTAFHHADYIGAATSPNILENIWKILSH